MMSATGAVAGNLKGTENAGREEVRTASGAAEVVLGL